MTEEPVSNKQKHAFLVLSICSTNAAQSSIKDDQKIPENCRLFFLALLLDGDTGESSA